MTKNFVKIKDAYIYSYNDFNKPERIRKFKGWAIMPDSQENRNWFGVTLNGLLERSRFVEINISLDDLYKLIEEAESLRDRTNANDR